MVSNILYIATWRNIQFDKKRRQEEFLEPELEVVRFGTEDIITTSFVNDGGTEGNIGGGEDTDEWGPETP